MARSPRVSRGWSVAGAGPGPFTKAEIATATKQHAVQSDVGATWTYYGNVLAGNLPAALADARSLSGRLREAVR